MKWKTIVLRTKALKMLPNTRKTLCSNPAGFVSSEVCCRVPFPLIWMKQILPPNLGEGVDVEGKPKKRSDFLSPDPSSVVCDEHIMKHEKDCFLYYNNSSKVFFVFLIMVQFFGSRGKRAWFCCHVENMCFCCYLYVADILD